MALISSTLNDDFKRHSLLILQSSLAQSSLPILRSVLIGDEKKQPRSVLFCLLYPPNVLIDPTASDEVYNWLDRVPGYNDADTHAEILATTEKVLQEASHSVNIIIDSTDTLLANTGDLSGTYKCLSSLYSLVKKHPNARLILHILSPSPLLPLITSTPFSASLVHFTAHPPALLHHLSSEFFILPPPHSSLSKFWSVFLPASERIHDTERLVFGSGGEGCEHPSEIVIELTVREGSGRKRGVDRVLEGWSRVQDKGFCQLTALESFKDSMKKQKEDAAPDPTQNLPFNLNLTSSQQQSRSQVPLPYAHEGKSIINVSGAIFYDPDSADDIDDDDPDEDLDI